MSKKHKYGVAPKEQRTWNGVVYDSKKEMNYAKHLEILKKSKNKTDHVIDIERQLVYKIKIGDDLICRYILDFKVFYEDGRIEYVDVKGYKKGSAYQMFKIKSKLVKAIYGIDIKEV